MEQTSRAAAPARSLPGSASPRQRCVVCSIRSRASSRRMPPAFASSSASCPPARPSARPHRWPRGPAARTRRRAGCSTPRRCRCCCWGVHEVVARRRARLRSRFDCAGSLAVPGAVLRHRRHLGGPGPARQPRPARPRAAPPRPTRYRRPPRSCPIFAFHSGSRSLRIVSSGAAMKIDEYAPDVIPTISANAKSLSVAPPKIRAARRPAAA